MYLGKFESRLFMMVIIIESHVISAKNQSNILFNFIFFTISCIFESFKLILIDFHVFHFLFTKMRVHMFIVSKKLKSVFVYKHEEFMKFINRKSFGYIDTKR